MLFFILLFFNSSHVQGLSEVYHETVELTEYSAFEFQKNSDPIVLWHSENDFGNVSDQLNLHITIMNTDEPVGVVASFQKRVIRDVGSSSSATIYSSVQYLQNNSEVRFTTQFYDLWFYTYPYPDNEYKHISENETVVNIIYVEFFTKDGWWGNKIQAEILLSRGPRTYEIDLDNKVLSYVNNPHQGKDNFIKSTSIIYLSFILIVWSVVKSRRRRRL